MSTLQNDNRDSRKADHLRKVRSGSTLAEEKDSFDVLFHTTSPWPRLIHALKYSTSQSSAPTGGHRKEHFVCSDIFTSRVFQDDPLMSSNAAASSPVGAAILNRWTLAPIELARQKTRMNNMRIDTSQRTKIASRFHSI